MKSAKGSYIYDASNRPFLDMISGISVSSLGHAHPAILKAIEGRLNKHLHVMVYGELVQDAQVLLAEKLISLLPPSLEQVYFTNSGSEAVEGALKLAKRFTGRYRLACFDKAYHGSTIGAMSVSDGEMYKKAYAPLVPGIRRLRFNKLDDLDLLDDSIAAVIIEPIQAEAGIRIATPEFLLALRKKCVALNILLIFDEAQSGCGRTGKLFAFEHYDVQPDVLILAKAFGGGLPLAAFIAPEKIMRSLSEDPPLGHISTFGGHPLSCAAALAALEITSDDTFLKQVNAIAGKFGIKLGQIPDTEFRQIGLLMGLEYLQLKSVENLCKKFLEKGILLDWFLFAPNVLRIAPPLNIDDQSIELFFNSFER